MLWIGAMGNVKETITKLVSFVGEESVVEEIFNMIGTWQTHEQSFEQSLLEFEHGF